MTTTPSTKKYLSCTETAKLIREALKAQFAGVKFSVRSTSYSGGASVNVSWTDGPTESQVKAITELYRGASFDGMIDLKSYHDSIIALDGEPTVVHFGADYVFTHRTLSPEAAAHAVATQVVPLGGAGPAPCSGCIGSIHGDGFYIPGSHRYGCTPECAVRAVANEVEVAR